MQQYFSQEHRFFKCEWHRCLSMNKQTAPLLKKLAFSSFSRHTYCIDRGQGLILLGRSIQFFPTWIPPLSSKILQKVTFKRCLQFITQFQLKISHALRFLSNQENVYCAFSCDLDYHGSRGFKFAQIWRLASVSMPLLSNERQYSRTDQTSQRVTHICIKLELVLQYQALCKTNRTIKIWATKKSSNFLFKVRIFQKWKVMIFQLFVSLNVIAFFKDPVTMLT